MVSCRMIARNVAPKRYTVSLDRVHCTTRRALCYLGVPRVCIRCLGCYCFTKQRLSFDIHQRKAYLCLLQHRTMNPFLFNSRVETMALDPLSKKILIRSIEVLSTLTPETPQKLNSLQNRQLSSSTTLLSG